MFCTCIWLPLHLGHRRLEHLYKIGFEVIFLCFLCVGCPGLAVVRELGSGVTILCWLYLIVLLHKLYGCPWCWLDVSGAGKTPWEFRQSHGLDKVAQGVAHCSPLLAVPQVGLNVPGALQACSVGQDHRPDDQDSMEETEICCCLVCPRVPGRQGVAIEWFNQGIPRAWHTSSERQADLWAG